MLLLTGADVERLLTPEACIAAVEDAFRAHALGGVVAPGLLAMHAESGSFHVKAGLLTSDRPYFAAKINANFPGNGRRGLPTIQGAVLLMDAECGVPLAMMDSITITALRTAAASAVAAKYLAREDCETLLICGCGGQAAAQLRAIHSVRAPRRVLAYDLDPAKAARFAAGAGRAVSPVSDLAAAARMSDIVVTCTTAQKAFIALDMVRPGAFIAAVGADNEHKQEIDPQLMAASRVVTDLTDQAAKIGDLHHAIAAGAMTESAVHAQLGEILAGRKAGRTGDDEIFVFDSTGTGLQDVAAAVAVYQAVQREGPAA
jgi:alanine dehydrogenase